MKCFLDMSIWKFFFLATKQQWERWWLLNDCRLLSLSPRSCAINFSSRSRIRKYSWGFSFSSSLPPLNSLLFKTADWGCLARVEGEGARELDFIALLLLNGHFFFLFSCKLVVSSRVCDAFSSRFSINCKLNYMQRNWRGENFTFFYGFVWRWCNEMRSSWNLIKLDWVVTWVSCLTSPCWTFKHHSKLTQLMESQPKKRKNLPRALN